MMVKAIEMEDKTEHNLGVKERSLVIPLKVSDLPKVITLELEDGSVKKYALIFAPKAEGLILNKAI